MAGFNLLCAVASAVSFARLGSHFADMFAGVPVAQQDADQIANMFRLPWVSLLLGALIGLPINLRHKRRLQKNRQEVLQQMLRPRGSGSSRSSYRANAAAILPEAATHLAAIAAAYALKLCVYPACFSPGISTLLWYPEHKSLYEEARRRLAQDTGSTFLAGGA